MEILYGIFFESKFDIEVEIIESYIYFNTSQADIRDQYPPKLAHQTADVSRPKEICRFSFGVFVSKMVDWLHLKINIVICKYNFACELTV